MEPRKTDRKIIPFQILKGKGLPRPTLFVIVYFVAYLFAPVATCWVVSTFLINLIEKNFLGSTAIIPVSIGLSVALVVLGLLSIWLSVKEMKIVINRFAWHDFLELGFKKKHWKRVVSFGYSLAIIVSLFYFVSSTNLLVENVTAFISDFLSWLRASAAQVYVIAIMILLPLFTVTENKGTDEPPILQEDINTKEGREKK